MTIISINNIDYVSNLIRDAYNIGILNYHTMMIGGIKTRLEIKNRFNTIHVRHGMIEYSTNIYDDSNDDQIQQQIKETIELLYKHPAPSEDEQEPGENLYLYATTVKPGSSELSVKASCHGNIIGIFTFTHPNMVANFVNSFNDRELILLCTPLEYKYVIAYIGHSTIPMKGLRIEVD